MNEEEKRVFIAEYRRNREENYHSENAVLLTEKFGTIEEKATAKMIFETHEKEGFLNSENASLRSELFRTIWARIEPLFEEII